MEGEPEKRKMVSIDWEKVLSQGDDEPPPTLIVNNADREQLETPIAVNNGGGKQLENPMAINNTGRKQLKTPMVCDWNQQRAQEEEIMCMNDCKLEETIERCRSTVRILKLPDGGAKLKERLRVLVLEKERRKLQRLQNDTDGGNKPLQNRGSNNPSTSDGPRQATSSTLAPVMSLFATSFCLKLENEDCRTLNASLHSGCQKVGDQSTSSYRKTPFQCPTALSADISRCNGNQGEVSSEKLSTSFFKRKKNSEDKLLKVKRPRNGQTVVLIDEEESQQEQSVENDDKLDIRLKERKIYYPTRDDPESVEICYSDLACLAPAAFLSSSIMNFYIRYLQTRISPTAGPMYDYHFFNTYFYKKLKEAVLNQVDRERAFVKLRRWWKGVNIFLKSYILIPIHEDQHWSLVIICILDKEDESGPIILHLDSLGLHFSGSIYKNIKCFLKEEWKCQNQGEAPLDLPIIDRIWKCLPRTIEEKTIAVPQQRNAYDCGIFVLYFMERFIYDAPQRLRKKDLAMFGKNWFRPEEASGLRTKIKALCVKQIQLEDNNNLVSFDNKKETFMSTSQTVSEDDDMIIQEEV